MPRASLALVLLLLLAAACGGGGTAAEEAAAPAQAERPHAPRIAGVTLSGDHVRLSDFEGKPTFVVVWASW